MGTFYAPKDDFEAWDREETDLVEFKGEFQLYENELEDLYDESLDDSYGTVSVAGYEYDTSRALKELDPIAWRVGYSDWLDSELGETIVEIDDETGKEVGE